MAGNSWRISCAACEPLGRPGRRHPDVDHGHVRPGLADQLDERGAVAGLAQHLPAGPLEKAGEALAEQDVVIGQDDPQPVHRRTGPVLV